MNRLSHSASGTFPDSGLARVLEEITSRRQAGVPLDPERCVAAYPEFAAPLRELLPTLDLIAGMSVDDGGPSTAGQLGGDVSGELGDFRIVREVGRGGMGIVYEAEQMSLGRRVALKVLPFAATLDPTQLQRFRNEARAAAGLHHEHIVPVHAVGCERGVHYFAMQFIDGDTLARLVPGPDRPPADFRKVARLIADAADALDYSHRLGIVHRDIKPANLMADTAGKVWVTDFGLARFGPDPGLTGSGGVVGTLRYMPPEQALVRHGLVDHRADVYGLGATLYELLTGRPAFPQPGRSAVLNAIATDDPITPRALDRSTPLGLETITLKCLAKDPAERYGTAGDLADDLRRWLAGRPVVARPLSMRQRAVRWVLRHRSGVAAAVAFLTVLGVSSAWIGIVQYRARESEARQRDRADANWRLAFEALDRVCLRLAESHLPRRAPSEAGDGAIVPQLLDYYEGFVRDNGSDPSVRYEAARACLRIGDLCQRLDRPAEAAVAYRHAVTRARGLAASFPDDPRYRRVLAAALAQSAAIDILGVIADRPTRYADAESAAREAVVLRTALRDRHELARAHDLLGLVLVALARPAEAEFAHEKARAVHEELARANPEVRVYRRDLAVCCVNLAVLRWSTRDKPEAAAHAGRALELWDELIRESSADPFSRRWRAKTLTILCAVGSDEAACERFGRRAVELHRELVADYAGVPTHRYELAAAWNWLGWHRLGAGRHAEATVAFGESLSLLDGLTAEFPARPDYPGSAGDTLANLSRVARARGDQDEGRRLWQDAQSRYRTAHSIDAFADRYREKIRREFGTAGELPGVHAGEPDVPDDPRP